MSYSWNAVELNLNKLNYHRNINIRKNKISHPSPEEGFEESIGEPESQLRDMRKRINQTESMHVREYEDRYEAHRDRFDPTLNPVGHLVQDCPEVPIGVTAALITGYKIGKAHFDKIKSTSDHPILESFLISLVSGGGIGLLTYLSAKTLRESLE